MGDTTCVWLKTFSASFCKYHPWVDNIRLPTSSFLFFLSIFLIFSILRVTFWLPYVSLDKSFAVLMFSAVPSHLSRRPYLCVLLLIAAVYHGGSLGSSEVPWSFSVSRFVVFIGFEISSFQMFCLLYFVSIFFVLGFQLHANSTFSLDPSFLPCAFLLPPSSALFWELTLGVCAFYTTVYLCYTLSVSASFYYLFWHWDLLNCPG